MCGIAGFLDSTRSKNADALKNIIAHMTDSIVQRGPDDSGAWVNEKSGVALGFRRLSIIDLSESGHQPMLSADGRYVIIFNGEVYNHASLRRELAALGHGFRGTSDTEVMLAAITAWGLKAAVCKFNGMFAFALWDHETHRLHLVRDRLGIKPLYYGMSGGVFLFGSELKPLRRHPAFSAEINRDALALFFRHSYIPAPFSIYQGISKLRPGCIATLETDSAQPEIHIEPYWSAREMAENGSANPSRLPEGELIEQLDSLLRQSIQERMVADVPLGAFLSGGIDSSTVVALMQTQSTRSVKTFTIGFHESAYDEAQYARQVAAHLGTEHTELYITPADAQAVIPHLPDFYDEPFADVSQIPTYLVSKLARDNVTVSLSGDGGDELFGGYDRYFWTQNIWRTSGWLPLSVRAALAKGIHVFSNAGLKSSNGAINAHLDRAMKLADILNASSIEALYYNLISLWKDPSGLVRNSREPLTALTDRTAWPNLADSTAWMMYMDLMTYLPDNILTKLDRASMSVSLEGRVPFLDDHRVVEFAWNLPADVKIRNGQGKWILRQVLEKYVPKGMFERPKMGFAVPTGAWLRGELRPWANELLSTERLQPEGFLDARLVAQKWEEHLGGKRNWQYYLWPVLMFQAWLEKQN